MPSANQPEPQIIAPNQEQPASIYQVACERPKDREEADLCEQRRMADAAERQLLVSIVGAGLVIFSLIFTGWAAFAASQAAKAAHASVKVASDTAERQLRAYVLIAFAEPTGPVPGSDRKVLNMMYPTAHVEFRNYGQTPAKAVTTWKKARFVDFPPAESVFDETDADKLKSPKCILGPGGQMSVDCVANVNLTNDDFHDIVIGKKTIIAYGQIDYVDSFGEDRWTKFRLIYTQQNMAFVPWETGNEMR